jgi:serine/threonine-protein kinase HipA
MAIGRDGHRLSALAGCIARAAEFALMEREARAITDHQRAVVERDFEAVCDEAGLSAVDRQLLRRGSVLHPFALGG